MFYAYLVSVCDKPLCHKALLYLLRVIVTSPYFQK
nr:MAG TPA: hypothetical protein [Caudoviricetes sp.]